MPADAETTRRYELPPRRRPAESMSLQERVDEVFELLESRGGDSYLGEEITKLEHAVQCALLAEKLGHADHVVLGCLLHDIGHHLDGPRMLTGGVDYGAEDHDRLGAEYLDSLLFPAEVAAFPRQHVQAKRYLVATRPGYRRLLSDASRATLQHQGGAMDDEEARRFEQLPDFEAYLQMRTWDEAGKDQSVSYSTELLRLKELCLRYLRRSC